MWDAKNADKMRGCLYFLQNLHCATFTKNSVDFLHVMSVKNVETGECGRYNKDRNFLFLGEMRKVFHVL